MKRLKGIDPRGEPLDRTNRRAKSGCGDGGKFGRFYVSGAWRSVLGSQSASNGKKGERSWDCLMDWHRGTVKFFDR